MKVLKPKQFSKSRRLKALRSCFKQNKTEIVFFLKEMYGFFHLNKIAEL